MYLDLTDLEIALSEFLPYDLKGLLQPAGLGPRVLLSAPQGG